MATISVLMPVHNGAAFLGEALDSILRQTCQDFEVLIVDDCSTDESAAIAGSCPDRRVRLIRAPGRLGICGALNLGLDHATGEFVARMDADDVSRGRRLERQIDYLARHPDAVLCGARVRRFGVDGTDRIDGRPEGGDDLRAHALFDNPLVHSTVMLRRGVLERFGLRYDEAFRHAEDYDLWVRMFPHGRAVVLPEVLLDYRVHSQSITTSASAGMDRAGSAVARRLLVELGAAPTDDELLFHRHLGTGRLYPDRSRAVIQRAEDWLSTLLGLNDRRRVYPSPALRRAVADVWYRACYQALPEGAWVVRRYLAFAWTAFHGARPLLPAIYLGAAAKARFLHRAAH